ncbi:MULTISPECIES: TlpA disulfide reductase family protein [Sanguibacteroides]|nr:MULTISPECIES: TlpA disulfide reductase family protein [Sanguibacteroides]PXZ43335.1 DUF4369 domain-containing protein [Sanguibacteroides justesenii]
MKKQLLFIAFIGIILTECTSNEYRIKGHVQGVKKAMAYLITHANNVADTIDQAEITDGKFEFRGSTPEVIPTLLVLSGHSLGGLPIYLENKNYKIEIDTAFIYLSKVKGGGEAQRIADIYRNFEVKSRKETAKYQKEFLTLTPEDKRFNELLELFDSIAQKTRDNQEAFMKQHANSYLALEYLASTIQKSTLTELQEGLNQFSPELQNSFSGRSIAAWIDKLEKAGIGKPAPDFTVEDPEGRSFHFYSIKAKVKLIDFWASWCSPCRAMVPELKKLYNEFHDKGFEIVSISMDKKKEAWVKAIEEEEMPWIHGCDFKGNDDMKVPLMKAYAFWGVPYLVLVDEDNNIVAHATGANELHKIKEALITILLGK